MEDSHPKITNLGLWLLLGFLIFGTIESFPKEPWAILITGPFMLVTLSKLGTKSSLKLIGKALFWIIFLGLLALIGYLLFELMAATPVSVMIGILILVLIFKRKETK